MTKLIKEYIKQLIEQQQNSDIIKAIVNKFPSDYTIALALALFLALAADKRDAFRERYSADEAFRKLMNSSYAYKKKSPYFDFWLNSLELREYLKPELKNAEMIVIEDERASAVSLNDVSTALEIAENVEELIGMIKVS